MNRPVPSHGCPRLHFEDSINADPIAVRDAIISVMISLQQEFPPNLEGIVSTEIVLAEVLNNIVEHSYEGSNMGTIHVSVLMEYRRSGKQNIFCVQIPLAVPDQS